jgi:hypothetical protein
MHVALLPCYRMSDHHRAQGTLVGLAGSLEDRHILGHEPV